MVEYSRSLLNKVSAVSSKYDKIAKVTGERFNIFSVLGLESQEVRTHSRFLAEMLNPQGSHGLGGMPLKHFLKVIKIHEFPTENTQVLCEYNIGMVDASKTRGGRIDILIQTWDKKMMIAIENKIYAGDQENQLLRYHNYLEDQKANIGLLYLTLTGVTPSIHSTGTSKEVRHRPISYAVEILEWLRVVQIDAVNAPAVRESIAQYINLVKKLTNQTENEKMAEEIAAVVSSNNENLDAFFLMHDSFDAIVRHIAEKNVAIWRSIAAEKQLEIKIDMHSGIYAGIFFENISLRNQNISIGFQFDAARLGKLCFGIFDGEKLQEIPRLKLKREFERQFGAARTTPSWPAYQYWDDYGDGKKLLLLLNSPEAKRFNQAMAEKIDIMLQVTAAL
ncbi:MAG: PD-(D/E)XK nuclease family protein [Spirochaetes bacterium]|nr:PD-(D/E)XK nuclease family protein [Spirochaetota bacterium]